MSIQIKRVYDAPSPDDGRRILVDRLWPRGLSREKAHVHQWVKEIAPSHALRRWYNHDPDRWVPFQARYEIELSDLTVQPCLRDIWQFAKQEPITLLFAAKDLNRNNAVVLRRWLLAMENTHKV